MNGQTAALRDVLKSQGYSLTKTREYVFNALADSDTLSMGQLIGKLRHKMDRASVYRTVDLFEKLGIVNRLQIGWKYKLELSDLFTEHHHHATCIQCGTVTSLIEDESLEAGIRKLAKEAGFNIKTHSLEIHGLCPKCQNTKD